MIKIIRSVFRFAVNKQITIHNIFNGNKIASYQSFDDNRVNQLLEQATADKLSWSKLNTNQKQQKIITFINKLNHKQNFDLIASLLSQCTGKQKNQAQAQLRVAIKILNYQLGYLFAYQKKREGNIYRFQPLDFVTSIFDHRHPILSAFTYLGLSLRSNNALILRPSPIVLPPIKLIEQLWLQSSQLKVVQCLVDSETDPKHDKSAVFNLLNNTQGFISFSGRMKDGLDFHYYMSCVNEVFRQNEFLLTSSDTAYVMKDLKSEELIKAAKIIARGCFSNCGSNFNSIKRVYVDRQLVDQFENILFKEAEQYTIDEKILTDLKNVTVNQGLLSPIANRKEYQECSKKINELKQKHSEQIKLIKGGQFIKIKSETAHDIIFMTPAIFRLQADFPTFNYQNVTYLMPICFIVPVDSTESCIQKINSSIYGITTSIFTKDKSLEKIEEIASKLDVGTVNVNTWQVTDGITYSGRKRSGKGFCFSPLSFNNIVRTKAVSFHQ